MVRLISLHLLVLLVAACNQNNRSEAIVSDLRLLAAKVEIVGDTMGFADADLVDRVRLTALIANPQGLKPLTVTWLACLPQTGQAVTPCQDQNALKNPSAIESAPGVTKLGEGATIDATVPAELKDVLAETIARVKKNPGAACSTYYDLPVLILVSAGGTKLTASKRVRLMPYHELDAQPGISKYLRNVNPRASAIRADATAEACEDGALVTAACSEAKDCGGAECVDGWCPASLASGQHTVCAKIPEESLQHASDCMADGTTEPAKEDIRFRWYATGGSFDPPSGGQGGLGRFGERSKSGESPFLPPSGPYTLWLVIRDGRGGENWVQRTFQ